MSARKIAPMLSDLIEQASRIALSTTGRGKT